MFRYAVVNLRKNLDGTMIESGLELADRIEAAWDINRVPGSRFQVPGRRANSLRIGLYTNSLDTSKRKSKSSGLGARTRRAQDCFDQFTKKA